MNQSSNEGSAVAITLDKMKDVTLHVNYNTFGKPVKLGDTSMLGFKVDYRTDKGYVKSIFYSLNNINGGISIPLGKKSVQDETENIGNNYGDYKISLKDKAPLNWDGRISICFIVNNCGVGSGAKYILSK